MVLYLTSKVKVSEAVEQNSAKQTCHDDCEGATRQCTVIDMQSVTCLAAFDLAEIKSHAHPKG